MIAGRYDSIVEAVNDLRARGYTYDFNIKSDCLFCEAIQLRLHPEEFHIDDAFRFEDGTSSPEGSSVVFAISSNDEKMKGLLIDAYGVYSTALTPAMAAKLRFD